VREIQTKTVPELEAILLAELRKIPGCENAVQVTVIARGAQNWICGPVRSGTAAASDCRVALTKLEGRMQHLYHVKA